MNSSRIIRLTGRIVFVMLAAYSAGTGAGVATSPKSPPEPGQAVPGEGPVRDRVLAELRAKIAGRENDPAGEVFKNIQIADYKTLRAQFLLSAMEFVFSRGLGVDCGHCHVVNEWEKDEKSTKQVARDMYRLMISIDKKLSKIQNLKGPRPIVSCYTCHRGEIKPEIELPELKQGR